MAPEGVTRAQTTFNYHARHFFLASGEPAQRVKARLDAAINRKLVYPSSYIVVSGADRGVLKYRDQVDPTATEARLMLLYLWSLGIREVLRDQHACETVGNVIFGTVAFAAVFGVNEIDVVSDTAHLPRLYSIAKHICRGYRINAVEARGGLSSDEVRRQLLYEEAGRPFWKSFFQSVSPGDYSGAIQWVAENHRSHYYQHLRLSCIAHAMRQQVVEQLYPAAA